MTVWTIGHSTRLLSELAEGFRGYADYMQTDAFASHVWALVTLAASTRLAMMCAEAAPDHCHRSLLADALVGELAFG